ncbi:thioesterase family protein [Streptomyces spiralis]
MRHVVTDADTTESVGSGDVPLLSTPRLIAWMEAATVEAAAAFTATGRTTVGTAIRVEHLRATPVGSPPRPPPRPRADGPPSSYGPSTVRARSSPPGNRPGDRRSRPVPRRDGRPRSGPLTGPPPGLCDALYVFVALGVFGTLSVFFAP